MEFFYESRMHNFYMFKQNSLKDMKKATEKPQVWPWYWLPGLSSQPEDPTENRVPYFPDINHVWFYYTSLWLCGWGSRKGSNLFP